MSGPTWAPDPPSSSDPIDAAIAALRAAHQSYDGVGDPALWLEFLERFQRGSLDIQAAELDRLYELERRVEVLEAGRRRRGRSRQFVPVMSVAAAALVLSGGALVMSDRGTPPVSAAMVSVVADRPVVMAPDPAPEPEPEPEPVPVPVPTTVTPPAVPATSEAPRPELPPRPDRTIVIPAAGYAGEWDGDISRSFTRDDGGVWRTIRWSGVDVSGRVLPEPGGRWSVLVVPARLDDVETGQTVRLGGKDWTVYRVAEVEASDQTAVLDERNGAPDGAPTVVLVDGLKRSENPDADLRPTVWLR